MKLPVVYIYKRTSDRGQELRYSMRSLKNIKNWNGEVYVCGDEEEWYSDKIKVITNFKRSAFKFLDAKNKMRAICATKELSDDFIFMNDDFFITTPITIAPLHDGKLEEYTGRSEWRRYKSDTRDYLISQGIKNPLNYALHVPMIFNKEKLLKVVNNFDVKDGWSIRSVYGNIYKIGGTRYKDRKTITPELIKGEIISTKLFTDELKKLFPRKSRFEL